MKRNNTRIPQEDQGPKMVVGLDIGTTKIVMATGYLCEDGKIEYCACGEADSIGVEFGLVINVQDTIDGIKKAKKEIENKTGKPVKSAFVGIAGRHIRSVTCSHYLCRINGRDNIIREEEIKKMNDDMEHYDVGSGTVISVVPQKYNVDGTDTYRPVGMVGQSVNATYQLITGNELEIRKLLQSVQNSDIKTDKLTLEPIASAQSCLTEEEKKNGVALIDIGGGTTDLIIYKAGVPVYIRVIPVGGQVVTKDIHSLGMMSYEEAEQLKITHGSCVPQNTDQNHLIKLKTSSYFGDNVTIKESELARVIGARVQRDILGAVKAEMESSSYMDDIMSVVLTGGGSELKDLKSLAEFVFQKRVRIGVPGIGFNLSQPLRDLQKPKYATVLGLLAYGCKVVDQSYQEIQEEVEEEETVSNTRSFMNGVNGLMNKIISAFAVDDEDKNGID